MNDKVLASMTMDNTRTVDNIKILNIQYGKFALQTYTAKKLQEMPARNGFAVLGQYGIDGPKLSEKRTKSILTVAKKL